MEPDSVLTTFWDPFCTFYPSPSSFLSFYTSPHSQITYKASFIMPRITLPLLELPLPSLVSHHSLHFSLLPGHAVHQSHLGGGGEKERRKKKQKMAPTNVYDLSSLPLLTAFLSSPLLSSPFFLFIAISWFILATLHLLFLPLSPSHSVPLPPPATLSPEPPSWPYQPHRPH